MGFFYDNFIYYLRFCTIHMPDLLLNLKVVLAFLFILNVGFIFLFKGTFRFIKGQLLLFSLVLSTFLIYRLAIYPAEIKKIETAKTQEIKKYGWDYINQPDIDSAFIKQRDKINLINAALFRIAGIQAAFGFIFAAIGLFLTEEKKLYGLYMVGFLLVAVLFFI